MREADAAAITIASQFIGKEIPFTDMGTRAARVILEAQHKKILPSIDRVVIQRAVAVHDPIIELTEQTASLSLSEEDFETALLGANHLYAYAEIDHNDSMGGRSLNLALRVHRQFTEVIQGRFLTTDPYLRIGWQRISPDIERFRKSADYLSELQLLRGVVNMVAFNGTLGEKAKSWFDPFAILQGLPS